MSLHPLINNRVFGYVIDTVCALAFLLHPSVMATLISFLIISALWTATSSFWNLYNSRAVSYYF